MRPQTGDDQLRAVLETFTVALIKRDTLGMVNRRSRTRFMDVPTRAESERVGHISYDFFLLDIKGALEFWSVADHNSDGALRSSAVTMHGRDATTASATNVECAANSAWHFVLIADLFCFFSMKFN